MKAGHREVALLTEMLQLKERLSNIRVKSREIQIHKIVDNAGIPLYTRPPTLYTIFPLRAHALKVLNVAWTRSDRQILTIGAEGCIIVWDALTGLIRNVLDVNDVQPVTADTLQNGDVLICGGLCANVVAFCLRHRPPEEGYSIYEHREVLEHGGQVTSIKCIDEFKLLTAAQSDGALVWDLEKVQIITRLRHPEADIRNMEQTSPDVSTFLTGTQDGVIRLWDIRQEGSKPVKYFEGHQSDVTCIRNLPNGTNFVSGSDDTLIHLYDTRTDVILERYGEPSTLILQPDESMMECYSQVDMAPFVETQKIVQKHPVPAIADLAVSSSGRMVISGCRDSSIYYWDIAYPEQCMNKEVEIGPVMKLTMSNSKNGIVMVTWDPKCRVRLMRPR